jgi:hypothetical protein
MVGNNVAWLNPALYILITFPLYAFWIWDPSHITALRCSSTSTSTTSSSCTFDAETFFNYHISVVSCLWAIPGLLNILVWSTSGMEGNVMGFCFALPLLIATLAYIVRGIMALVASMVYTHLISLPSLVSSTMRRTLRSV